ncbi:MAG TPA: endolytic transglycosylase MltG, partial [Emcibacteraceae bacterium]|nr:endolytic transglycosylase MltG [Emcibacteraceae bacterium]
MKQFLLSFLSLCLLGMAAVAVLGGVAVHHYLSPGTLPESKLVLIEKGKGVSAIADKLAETGVITQPLLFKIVARFSDSLKAGEYDFPAKVSMAEAMDMMREGKVYDRKITIPEGLTSYQIVKLLNAREDLAGEITDI